LIVVGSVGILFSVAGAWISFQAVGSVVETVESVDETFGDTLDFVSESLAGVNTPEMQAGLEDRVSEIKAGIGQTSGDFNNGIRTGRAALLLLFIWLGLTQLVPLYVGADLLADGRLGSRLLSREQTT
jgi:hypothetical protein